MAKAKLVEVRFTLRLRDQHSIWVQDRCKVYMASNGSRFMVSWTICKTHLMEVGLTQNRETMALQMFTTVELFHFIMCEDPHEQKFIEKAFGWGPDHIRLHTTLEGPWPPYMHGFEGVPGRPLDNFFWSLGSCVKWPLDYAPGVQAALIVVSGFLRTYVLILSFSLFLIWDLFIWRLKRSTHRIGRGKGHKGPHISYSHVQLIRWEYLVIIYTPHHQKMNKEKECGQNTVWVKSATCQNPPLEILV